MKKVARRAAAHLNRGLDFGHSEIETDHVSQIRRILTSNNGFGVITDHLQSLCELRVIGYADTALSCVDVFVVIQTVSTNIGKGTSKTPFVPCTGRLC